jgi:hypothetical protein
MTTNQLTKMPALFPQLVSSAVSQLKLRLQHDYEQAYPDLREIVHLVLNEEESKAWELSAFPHLLLPDLVEQHIAKLNLQAAETGHDHLFASQDFAEIDNGEPAFALCAF